MIHIWEVKAKIEIAGTQRQPFRLKFVKKEDGSIREMIAIKKTKPKKPKEGKNDKSNFGYNLSENFLLLLQECREFKTQEMNHSNIGTVNSIINLPASLNSYQPSDYMLQSKTVSLYSIIEYNGEEVFA